jgi:hypothetical protein
MFPARFSSPLVARSFPSVTTYGKAFLAMDSVLDSVRTGPLYLRMPEVAKMVVNAIHSRTAFEALKEGTARESTGILA